MTTPGTKPTISIDGDTKQVRCITFNNFNSPFVMSDFIDTPSITVKYYDHGGHHINMGTDFVSVNLHVSHKSWQFKALISSFTCPSKRIGIIELKPSGEMLRVASS